MSKVGYLKDGKFVAAAQNFDIMDAPTGSETTAGFISPSQVQKLDKAYTTDDVANETDILSEIFNK